MSQNRYFADPRLTEQRNPRTLNIDVASSAEIVELLHAEEKTVAAAVYEARDAMARTIDFVVESFKKDGRLFYVGAGTSGRLGMLDSAECPPTFGSDPERVIGIIAGGPDALIQSQEGAEDDVEAGGMAIEVRNVGPNDVVIGIATSGSTPFVHAAISRAKELCARTALITCTDPPPVMKDLCDEIMVAKVGPEALTGSTRLKAGTATKMILNTISTGAMIRVGKAYGNFMVDLTALSHKLVDRGERIVIETCGVDRTAARAAIKAAAGSVKVAIVMLRRDVDISEALRLLAESCGRVRPIVGDPPPVLG